MQGSGVMKETSKFPIDILLFNCYNILDINLSREISYDFNKSDFST